MTIDHQPVTSWAQLQERVTPSAGRDLPFEVRRKGKLLTFTVKPEATPQKDPVTKVMGSVDNSKCHILTEVLNVS